jgi:hypothetical protein
VTVFHLALYGTDEQLVRSSEAYPVDEPGDPQAVANQCARAADTGCRDHLDGRPHGGRFLIWADRTVRPPQRLEDAPKPDGRRSYGGQYPPIPPTPTTALRPVAS